MSTNEEKLARVRACNTPEDLLGVLRDEGIELDEEFLDGVAGGGALFNGEKVAEMLAKLGDSIQGLAEDLDLMNKLRGLASDIMMADSFRADYRRF